MLCCSCQFTLDLLHISAVLGVQQGDRAAIPNLRLPLIFRLIRNAAADSMSRSHTLLWGIRSSCKGMHTDQTSHQLSVGKCDSGGCAVGDSKSSHKRHRKPFKQVRSLRCDSRQNCHKCGICRCQLCTTEEYSHRQQSGRRVPTC